MMRTYQSGVGPSGTGALPTGPCEMGQCLVRNVQCLATSVFPEGSAMPGWM